MSQEDSVREENGVQDECRDRDFVYRDTSAKDADTGGCENDPLVHYRSQYFLYQTFTLIGIRRNVFFCQLPLTNIIYLIDFIHYFFLLSYFSHHILLAILIFFVTVTFIDKN